MVDGKSLDYVQDAKGVWRDWRSGVGVNRINLGYRKCEGPKDVSIERSGGV